MLDAAKRKNALVDRRMRSISLSLPGLTRQSTLALTRALRVDARVILGFQTGHRAPNGNPRTGHDNRCTFGSRR